MANFNKLMERIPPGCAAMFDPNNEGQMIIVASGSDIYEEHYKKGWIEEEPRWFGAWELELAEPVADKPARLFTAEWTRKDLIQFALIEGLDPEEYTSKDELCAAINAARGLRPVPEPDPEPQPKTEPKDKKKAE